LFSEGHCTSRFKRARGTDPAYVDACGQGKVKNRIFCGRHKWMAPWLELRQPPALQDKLLETSRTLWLTELVLDAAWLS